MKTTIIRAIALTAIALTATVTIAANGTSDNPGTYGQGRGQGYGRTDGRGAGGPGNGAGTEDDLSVLLESIEKQDLSSEEIEGLMLMYEEEKLARDVYRGLYDLWNLPVFANISASEQQHMESVGVLIERYELDLPQTGTTTGVFENPVLQGVYDDLMAQGSESLLAALTVGATVEDLDIADLQQLIDQSDNDDIRIIYQNLMKGSRNHMRSFVSQIERNGGSYSAQYISDEYLATILSFNNETAAITDPEYRL